MSDFTIDSTFNEESEFNKVRIGGDSPILESELNEIQDIQNSKREELAKAHLRNGIGSISAITQVPSGTDVTVTISNTQIFLAGKLLTIDSLEQLVGDGQMLYLRMKEAEIDYTDVVKKYGNQQEVDTVTNNILDVRYGAESSRRVQVIFDLTLSNGDPTYEYLEIGNNSGGTFVTTVDTFIEKIDGSQTNGIASLGADGYRILTPAFSTSPYKTYPTGMTATMKVDVSNTGPSTLQVDSGPIQAIKVISSTGKVDTKTGDIIAYGTYSFVDDGTDWILTSPNAILQSLVTAQGDMLYATGPNTIAKIAKGTASQTLKMNSGATAPEWASDTISGSVKVEGNDSTTAIAGNGTITKLIALGYTPKFCLLTLRGSQAGSHTFNYYVISPAGTTLLIASRYNGSGGIGYSSTFNQELYIGDDEYYSLNFTVGLYSHTIPAIYLSGNNLVVSFTNQNANPTNLYLAWVIHVFY